MLKGKQLLCILLSAVLLIVSAGPVFAAENEPAIPQEQAAEVTRVEEIVAWRETDSETYLLSDGTYECVIYAGDKYYRDATNTLQLIDNSIILDAETAQTTNRQYKNAANSFALSFSESEKPRITLEQQGVSLTFSALTASGGNSNHITMDDTVVRIGGVQNCAILNEMTDTGDNTITYPNAFYNSDLVYVVKDHALKEYIILENSYAPNTFSFLFEMEGLTLETSEDSACFIDAAGNPVFALDSLFAVDANGVLTEALTYDFFPVKDTGDVIITVILDETYLQSEDRAFPVVIDPTLMISSVETADACVCSNHLDTNYRNAFQLRTGYDGNDYGIRRSYIKFNIPSTLSGKAVVSASLELEKISGADPTTKAYRCLSDWSSGTITWANKPGYSVYNSSTEAVPYRAGSTWFKMDATTIVQNWLNGSYNNYGFVIKDTVESLMNHWTTLYSSDADSPHKPELHIVYVQYDTIVAALDDGEHPRHAYFDAVRSYVTTYRKGSSTYHKYNSFEKDYFIDRLKSTLLFFVHTHGEPELIDLGIGGRITIDDLNSVDLSNLKLVLLLTCDNGKYGYSESRVAANAPVNMVERMVICGAETVIGFNDVTYVQDCNKFAESFARLTMRSGLSVQEAIATIDCSDYTSDMGDTAVIGGNQNLRLKPYFD